MFRPQVAVQRVVALLKKHALSAIASLRHVMGYIGNGDSRLSVDVGRYAIASLVAGRDEEHAPDALRRVEQHLKAFNMHVDE